MATDRIKVLDPAVALDTDEYITDVIELIGYGQLSIEALPANMVGSLKIVLELSPDGDVFLPEALGDPASGSAIGGDYLVPTFRLVHTWDGNDPMPMLQIPCAGYQKARLKVSAGTSGNAMIFLNRLRLAAN